MYLNNPSQYDIVNLAKLIHTGFNAKCKEFVMKCIGVVYLDSRKKYLYI